MRLITRYLAPLAALLLLAAPSAASAASPGDLDSAFGAGGKTTLDLGSDELGTATAAQPDGKVVVVGKGPSLFPDFAVARYNRDGTLDKTFDGDGVQTISFGRTDIALAVAIQPDGGIVVAGQTNFTSTANPNDFAVARLTTDGALDKTFDGDGTKQVDMGGDDQVRGVALQGDRIVLAGDSGSNFAFLALTKSGALDSTFSGDGVQSVDLGGTELVRGLASGPGGQVLAAGTTNVDGVLANANSIALVQLDGTGELDGSFSGDGKQIVDFGSAESAGAVAYQSDGRAIVVGSAQKPGPDLLATRVDASGAVDRGFGVNGVRTVDAGGVEVGHAVAIAPGDRIVMAGVVNVGVAVSDFVVASLDANGVPDPSFSGDGVQTVDFGAEDAARGVAVANDRAYVAGFTGSSGRNIAVASLVLPESPVAPGTPPTGDDATPAPPPTTPPTTPPAGPQPDRTAPVLRGVKLAATTFTARKGTKLAYRLSEKGKVTLTVERLRRSGGRTAFARFAKVTAASVAGTNRLRLRRKVGKKTLTPGRYRLTLVATDAAGNRSKPARAKFTVKR